MLEVAIEVREKGINNIEWIDTIEWGEKIKLQSQKYVNTLISTYINNICCCTLRQLNVFSYPNLGAKPEIIEEQTPKEVVSIQKPCLLGGKNFKMTNIPCNIKIEAHPLWLNKIMSPRAIHMNKVVFFFKG